MIIVIIAITISNKNNRSKSNKNNNNNNNNNTVIIDIRIEILQGASLGMGSLHIKVIVSNFEGRDYNIVLFWLTKTKTKSIIFIRCIYF